MAPFKRRKAASWTKNNEVLPDGEPGYERDTGKLKVGNGVTAWNDLPYFGGGTPPDGGDDGDELPMGVPTFKGIYDPAVQYLAGDMVKSAGVAWIALTDNIGELPALPVPDVNPLTTLEQTAAELNTKPFSAPYLEFGGNGWDHYYRYFDIFPGGSIVITPAACDVGKIRVLDSRDPASPQYGTVLYDSQDAGVPVSNAHSVHNLQPGRYLVDNNAINSSKAQNHAEYVPELTIVGTNGAVLWGVDNSDAPSPSWISLAPPVE